MEDIEDFILYFKNLYKGYDTRLFEAKLEEFGEVVTNQGLYPRELNELIEIWLTRDIMAGAHWNKFGYCLIPSQKVDDSITKKVAFYAVTHYTKPSKVKQYLLWLTALLDHNLLNVEVLYDFYDFFYNLFQIEHYSGAVFKLIHTLTKPTHITRDVVLDLLHQKTIFRSKRVHQIDGLLSLFKSYRPECVPEPIPALSLQSIFHKIPRLLEERLTESQRRRENDVLQVDTMLVWQLSFTIKGPRRARISNQVIADVDFLQLGSTLYSDAPKKSFLHLKNATEVLKLSLEEPIALPSQLESLLCNEIGMILLTQLSDEQQAVFSHKVYHLLWECIVLDSPKYTLNAKADFLARLADFQYIACQPIPVVSQFLAEYLYLWNGGHYFKEVLRLLEWLTFDSFEQLEEAILEPIHVLCVSSLPRKRLYIFTSLHRLYTNMCYLSRRKEPAIFLTIHKNKKLHNKIIEGIADFIQKLSRISVMHDPSNVTAQLGVIDAFSIISRSEAFYGIPNVTICPGNIVGCVLFSFSPVAFDWLSELMLRYIDLRKIMKRQLTKETRQHFDTLETYMADMGSALIHGTLFIEARESSIISRISPTISSRAKECFVSVDSSLMLQKHIAFAQYTYMSHSERSLIDHTALLKNYLAPTFTNIPRLLKLLFE